MISGPLIRKKLASRFVGDGARQPRLAGAGRPVQQHALGRIDAEPLEQFGIAQRQLDHLAQLVDRRRHAADIVIGDVGAAAFLGLLVIGAQLDLGVLVDMDDALGHRSTPRPGGFPATHRPARAGIARRCGGSSSPPTRCCPTVATISPWHSGRPAKLRFSATDDPCSRTFFWAGAQHDAGRRLRIALAHLDEIARADAGIGALQPVDAGASSSPSSSA